MTVGKVAAGAAAILTVLLVQASIIGPLTFPVPVSLPALIVIVVAIYAGPGVGVGMGFTAGLVADLGSQTPAGAQALCWLLAGLAAGVLGGLLSRHCFAHRPVAILAAVLGALCSGVLTVVLALLGSPGASIELAARDIVPVGLVDAVLAFALVPAVFALLRAQGVRAAHPGVGPIPGTDARAVDRRLVDLAL